MRCKYIVGGERIGRWEDEQRKVTRGHEWEDGETARRQKNSHVQYQQTNKGGNDSDKCGRLFLASRRPKETGRARRQ